ncbi:MAG: GNAT family N-acetyltransferase [Hyphomicrobiaceae bacterium]|nr:GNAT family N-acetyltransferase [Hyphomicrobiaceae bacterium]MCC0025001.1 GNAT family N-acetyltransferase [Hyphomicrobiaceae bacterium]
MTYVLEIDRDPPDMMREEVRKGLREWNLRVVPTEKPRGDFAVYVRDPASEVVVGGLWAEYYYDWMFIEFLSVPEDGRGEGLGRRMVLEAESFARELKLTGIWLDTFSWQAQGFYEKLGYSVFGQIEDFPEGQSRMFLKKRLD